MAPGSADNEEIQRFEEQYRRNPDSLVFARLADAWRKAGDPQRALDLLRDGIQRHPDYPTAHLVRARALTDLERPADAEESLRRVLELDGQNLVAMRDLAVLAEKRGDPLEAVHWYEQIDVLDPGNPEAAEALERLRGSIPRTPPGMEPLPAPREEWWSSPTFEIGDAEPSGELEEAPEAEAVAETEAAEELDVAPEPEAAPGPEPEAPPEPDAAAAPVELTADDLRSTWSEPDVVLEADAAAELDELAAELDAIMAADRAMDEEGASEEEPAQAVDEPTAEAEVAAPDETSPPEAADARPDAKSTAWWFEDPADADGEDGEEDGDLLTRTMADLYVKQGLLDDAAAIYRELLADRPDDDDLRRALEDVERRLSGPPATESQPEPGEPSDAEAVPSGESASVVADTSAGESEPTAEEPGPAMEPVASAAAVVADEPSAPAAEAVDPYATHPAPARAGTSEYFREWLGRLSE
ncbi:MAG: tetratricopeptide repeat protein [Gemmatimonadales bacterium]|jgi:tetratricopeptide (TPR) repeat protein